jgi:hypothetical protein
MCVRMIHRVVVVPVAFVVPADPNRGPEEQNPQTKKIGLR